MANDQGESLESRVKHLCAVEGLSIRQIAKALHMGTRRISRIISGGAIVKSPKPTVVEPYARLIEEWYQEHPYLQAQQVFERLKPYGYAGSYVRIVLHTRKYRRKSKKPVFHELTFLPGEEAQVDWMQWRLPSGIVYGFSFFWPGLGICTCDSIPDAPWSSFWTATSVPFGKSAACPETAGTTISRAS